MRKGLCIMIGLTIVASVASAAPGKQPSPTQRIIAQDDASSLTVLRRQALLAPARQQALPDRRSPDSEDAAPAVQPTLDPAIVKYLERYGFSRSRIAAMSGGLYGASQNPHSTVIGGRSPDTRDGVLDPHTTPASVVVTVGGGGFDWGDAAIGGATVFALALALVGAGGVALLRGGGRQKVHG